MNKVTLYDILVFVGVNTDDADVIVSYLDNIEYTLESLVEFLKEYSKIVKIDGYNFLVSFVSGTFYVTIKERAYRIKRQNDLYELVGL